jgi:predicted Fe-Mo cluster-binding NifX family protein
MKIGIPVMSDSNTLDNIICDHFGSAPFFAIVETAAGTMKVVENANTHHQHGACNPLAAFTAENIEAAMVRGIGAGAISKLQAAGIPVFQANNNNLKSALDDLKANRLKQMTPEDASAGHSHHGHGHS